MQAHRQRSRALSTLNALPRAMRGYVLIGSLAAMAVLSTLGYVVVQDRMQESRQDAAELAGTMGAQFKQALRALIAREGTGLPTGTFTGVNWLKDSGSCAGATGSARYLPCEFPALLPLGLSYRTVVTSAAGVVTATVTFGTPSVGGNTHPTLAGRVVSAINGTSADYSTPATQTYYVATNNVTTGAVSMVVTNSQENLEFVKVDGSSTISADHDWNNFSISNLRNLRVNGTVTANAVNANAMSAGSLSATNSSLTNLTSTTANVLGTLTAARARSSRAPTSSSDLANKAYVDSVAGGPSCSFSSRGSCVWNNGLIQNWGRLTIPGKQRRTLTFHRAFVTTPVSVQFSEYWSSTGANWEATIYSKTRLGVTITNNDQATLSYDVFASGR